MTSRERVTTALDHREPDRVPIDFGAMRSTGIMALAYGDLRRHLGITDGHIRIYDTMQQLAVPEPVTLERFDIDVVDVLRHVDDPDCPNLDWQPWKLRDGTDALRPSDWNPVADGEGGWLVYREDGTLQSRMPESCLYCENVYRPLAAATTPHDIETMHDWAPYDEEELDYLRCRARWLFENTDYAILGGFGGNILEGGQELRGWEQFMLDLAADRPFAGYLMDRLAEYWLERLDQYLDAVGDYIQVIQMGDDLGTQTAPQMSPAMYHETIHPRHKRIYQRVHERAGGKVRVFLHACGSIYDLIPDLIDEGVEVLNPVQTSAAKMDPKTLKREYGKHLAFWGGGCDTQQVLPYATPEAVRDHVRERLEIWMPGGGYVFNQVHNVQAGVPPENIVAMLDTAAEFGGY